MPIRPLLITLMVAVATVATSTPALAQPGARSSDSFEKLMNDFLFYIRIDNPEVAADIGRVILDQGLSEVEFAAAIEDGNLYTQFEDGLGKALNRPELEPIVAEMDRLYREGKRAEARDPQEISRNISMLVSGLRARKMARDRLIAASEYAMVQLLEVYLDPNAGRLRTEVETVMIDMGPGAVMPLCAALPHLPPTDQEQVIKVLGLIEYPTALPFIAEVLLSDGVNESVSDAAVRAIAQIGQGDLELEPALLYFDLAESYFDERSELTVFPGEDYQLIWSYNDAFGLQMGAIATPVFHEAMCMRLAKKSMSLERYESREAVALWVAANFKREIESPAGYDNPEYPADWRDAMFYAVSCGAGTSQAVLDRALDTTNTQLARRAIEALSKTAGGEALWTGEGGRPAPLLAALQYPDRRVQYESALVLGAAQPQTAFPGAERVVPTLAGAVRDAGDQYALILTQDRDAYNEIRGIVNGVGYSPLAFAPNMAAAGQQLADAPGVDLLVIDMPSVEGTADVLEQARLSPKLTVAPTLLMTSPEGAIELGSAHRGDRLVFVRQRSVSPDMLRNAITGLVDQAAGGRISTDESRTYTAESLMVLKDLAISGNSVLVASEAVRPLLVALTDTTGPTQLSVAEVLAYIDQSRAQVAIVDAALDATGEHQAQLIDIAAGSARRYGNMLEPRHVDELVGISRTAADREATAAAALLGSLDLQNRDLVPLILEPMSKQAVR